MMNSKAALYFDKWLIKADIKSDIFKSYSTVKCFYIKIYKLILVPLLRTKMRSFETYEQ